MSRVGHMGRPYTPCRLFYDSVVILSSGDYLLTPAGSAYLVERVRLSRNCRQYLECVRWPAAEIPPEAHVYPLHWYPRNKKPARTLASLAPGALS